MSSKPFEKVIITKEYDLHKVVGELLSELQLGPLSQEQVRKIKDAGRL